MQQRQRQRDEVARARFDPEAQPLLEAHRPQDAGRIVDEGYRMHYADLFFFQIAQPAPIVINLAEAPRVERESERVDREIAPV